MNNRHMSSSFHSRGRSHSELPMDYINRALARYNRSPRRQHHSTQRGPPPSPAAKRHTTSPVRGVSESPRRHRRKHHWHKMASFDGPWSQDLDGLKKTIQSMPDQYKSTLSSVSKDTLQKVCDHDVLHVWETDSDMDNLLQLTSVIAKLCNLGTRKDKGANANDGSMVIIAEDKAGRNNFGRICQLVEHLTCANGKKHLEGTVAAFGSIVVVKGWNNSVRSDNAGKEVSNTVKRINIALERTMKMGSNSKKKLVWHHGPVIHFLLYWINSTSSTLRYSLYAITITGSLDLTSSIKPSKAGSSNTLPDLTCLETYATKLDIPVVFLDPMTQLITSPHLATYMYYFGYYINTFLPASLSRPHLHLAQDQLLTFAFRILGASSNKYGDEVVKAVKSQLNPSTAKSFARTCVSADSYTKSACRAAGKEHEVHHATHLADSPFALFHPSQTHLPAFARLSIGPAAPLNPSYALALPISISYAKSRIRPSHPSHIFTLLPTPDQDNEKVTHRIQGTMMAVLERVRQEKGNPHLGEEERGMWREVRKGVEYALGRAKGKMPEEVEGRVKFVGEKVGKGVWGMCLGSEGKGGKDGRGEAARANEDAGRIYGGGQQQAVGFGFGGQHGVVNQGVQQGMMAPPNSPGIAQPIPQQMGMGQGMYAPPTQAYTAQGQGYGAPTVQHQGRGYGAPPMGYGPQQQQPRIISSHPQTPGISRGYGAQQGGHRGGGGSGKYPQSMGGSWL